MATSSRPMCSLLPSQSRAFVSVHFSIRSPQCQRSSIHYWQYIRQRGTLGAPKILKYEALAVPKLESQPIRLWEAGGDYLGLIPIERVLRDHLRPGYMLSLRGDPPPQDKSAAPPPGGYDYEVRALDLKRGPDEYKHADPKALRAKGFYLSAGLKPEHLWSRLRLAYSFLEWSGRKPGITAGSDSDSWNGDFSKEERAPATVPAEFHIRAPGPLGRADLSLFTGGRMDLHPAVILRALPAGVFQLLAPRADLEAGDALWLVATGGLRAWPHHSMPQGPAAMADKAQRMDETKRRQVAGLLKAGKIGENGGDGAKFRHGLRAREEEGEEGGARKRGGGKRKGNQPDGHGRSARRTESLRLPKNLRGLVGPMEIRAKPTNGDQEGRKGRGVEGVEKASRQYDRVPPGYRVGDRPQSGRPAERARPEGARGHDKSQKRLPKRTTGTE